MKQANKIRVKVLGLIRNQNQIFVCEGYDSVKQQTYYRALGGSIDFGEDSLSALQREFQEEIQAELTNIKYLGCVESIFTFEARQSHEILQVYSCDFADSKFYQVKELFFTELSADTPIKALWTDISSFKSGKLKLVPEGFCDFI
uniref:NUDIX hydrolase n=1 Tax=Calothrix sp. PCC 6303 TaxID=1170562 RepID=UPI00059FF3A1|nr:NUDIX domain-containing protein [Calothrix sp. PCC 6303]